MNFYIVGSPWHLLVAASINHASEDGGIFLLEEVSESSLSMMVDTCKRLNLEFVIIGSINKVRFVNAKLLALNTFKYKVETEIAEVQNSFLNLLNKFKPVLIYYFNFYSPITRAQLLLTENIELVRVEDGICDYFNFPFIYYSPLKRIGKIILTKLLGLEDIYSQRSKFLESKTKEYKLFFPEKVKGWKGRKTTLMNIKGDLHKIIEQLALNSHYEQLVTEIKPVLIIGQTLYEDNILSLSSELNLYKSVLDKFNETVYFKPHPRSSSEKVEFLSNLDSRFIVLNTPCAVEELLVKYNFRAIVGMWSNPIIYGRKLFNVETFTLIDISEYKEFTAHTTNLYNSLCLNFETDFVHINKISKT